MNDEIIDLAKFKENKERLKAKREMSLSERFELERPLDEPLKYTGEVRPSYYHWSNSDGESGKVELVEEERIVSREKISDRSIFRLTDDEQKALFDLIEKGFLLENKEPQAFDWGFVNDNENK